MAKMVYHDNQSQKLIDLIQESKKEIILEDE
jgi:hypothetical protein